MAQKAAKVEAPVIDVEKFILDNVKPYSGDASFLAPATERTKTVWKKCEELLNLEREKGVLDIDCKTPSTIISHGPGYIIKEKDVIVGLQTDAPLKRAIKPKGGWRVVEGALQGYGYKLDESVKEIFPRYRKTHNDGVFDVYSPDMLLARKYHLLTGLPDAYGRGRIIGDYRRVALYGIDGLIAAKKKDHQAFGPVFDEETIRTKEEVAEQIKALNEIKQMAASYGCDISKPATSAKEAIQWTYFGFLAAVKEQDGAAMSMGRIDSFLDIYIEKDLAAGKITEAQAQEMIDDFVIKLRLVRHVRAPAFNALFAGDPTWVTVSLGGVLQGGKPGVTKTSFRVIRTLQNLGPAPEPNITVLWENSLPEGFKSYASLVSIETSSLQFENDKMMRDHFGCDYSVACCVSGMKTGKEMQFFGARCNFPKLLLYSMNEGKDEMEGAQAAPKFKKLSDGPLKYDEVMANFEEAMRWMAGLYMNTLNVIHYMHDKYCYEAAQMALHDTQVKRMLAMGVSGLSVLVDSLSAIKYAKVTPIRNDKGVAVDFKIEGNFPKYGNDDNSVDEIGPHILNFFSNEIKKHKPYRNSHPTLSVLTITSNVVYGEATGTTPDGRLKGTPFAPGANPMNARDTSGALASLNSVAKLPYDQCLDGISNTFSIIPSALGKDEKTRTANLCALLSGYLGTQGHHLNVNVMEPATLKDAMANPHKYPSLTIRVSGYAVNFVRLTREQQLDVISRTFHQDM